jgi:hypothetical protein
MKAIAGAILIVGSLHAMVPLAAGSSDGASWLALICAGVVIAGFCLIFAKDKPSV